MIETKFFLAIIFVLVLISTPTSNAQTCSYMWDPIFESDSNNLPTMCPVETTSGQSCVFPFNYGGVTYKTCTIQGPNNGNYLPQCATSVNSNNTVVSWSFCTVPNNAVVSYVTVRKGGPWSQNSGSSQGGTMIWIHGRRFAENSFSSLPSVASANTVQLVDGYTVYNCEMHNDKTTTSQLTCYVPMMPESVYQIRVYVNGNLIPLYQYENPTRATFIPTLTQTPLVNGIVPQSGTPQTIIELSGDLKTPCYSRDVDGCSQDNNPLISRIFVGGQLCNLVDQATGLTYGNISTASLKCLFEGTEVGLFNVSMLIGNEYGRALVNPSLYRVSADEKLYTFQSYATVSSVSPSSGSTVGGTVLTITGDYFSHSTAYPLVVKVGREPCFIISSSRTTIQCQTSADPANNLGRNQGGRGLQRYIDAGFTAQSSLSVASPPSPSSGATTTWTDDALYVSSSSTAETVWFIGFLHVQKAGTYTFSLDTNGAAALFLSTDDNPSNKVLVVDATSNFSAPISLQNHTNYYLFCVGSRSNGYLRLGARARLHETKLTSGVSNLVQNEIQRIDVTRSIVPESQSIVVSAVTSNGTSEVQSIEVASSTFQIGFLGVYTAILTGRPTAATVQTALNDLPSIYPLTVSVEATSTLYLVTFPMAMGNVPLLTCISSAANRPNITEITPGVASGNEVAFALDGQLSRYLDFVNSNVTQATLTPVFNELFSIRCPPSLNDPRSTPSIVYAQDFESNCVFDETSIRTNAFCGQCSLNDNYLVSGNSQAGRYLCFAYRITNKYVVSMGVAVQINGDTTTIVWGDIPLTPKADLSWHYTCVDVQEQLVSQGSISSTDGSLVIQQAWLKNEIKSGIFLDTITIRNALPNGYESSGSSQIDQSANDSCVFPFIYNGQSYSACTLDSNNFPVCADNANTIQRCRSSSIEGTRRLYPKHQLVHNTLQVTYVPLTTTITVNFRYSDCTSPSLMTSSPSTSSTVTRATVASGAASGTFDLVFNGQTYTSISVSSSASALASRLQGSQDFGFLNVKRTRDCTGYSYTVEWIANGGAKSMISTANAGSVTPAGTTVTVSRVQHGGVMYSPLTGDLTRTTHANSQVEVFVGGYPSRCIGSNTCDYQWLSSQTPSITSTSQAGSVLTITGTGFSTTASSNNVVIGESGSCTVTAATTTSLTCTISAAPAGTYPIAVNVNGKGLASGASGRTATVSLQVASFTPVLGGAGGGYTMTILGSGFSTSSIVKIDGNVCTNPVVTNFANITCTVPSSMVVSNTAVSVVVSSGASTATASSQFTYDVTNTPMITSSGPSLVTIAGGELNITGTNFGTDIPAVYVGTTRATVRSSSQTQIIAILPSLAPDLYSIRVQTTNGFARPTKSIEYRFYVQNVVPHVTSLYGGETIYVQGEGFDSNTVVSFSDGSSSVPCNVVSQAVNQIVCRTETAAPRVVISASGTDPTYGQGFAWSPSQATVQQGAIVEWRWGLSSLLSTINYKVQQVSSTTSTASVSGGFDSGNATSSGSFTYQFQTIGTYYFYTPPVDPTGQITMRGVINVVAAQPRTLTANVVSGSFRADSCVFPFTFDSNTYSSCTTVNDTQSWCSKASVFNYPRLYCTPTASVPAHSCVSSSLINPTSCSQTVPTGSLEVLFTPCTMGTVTAISPSQGPSGTTITITGTGFSTTVCENTVMLGSSYECPIQSVTSTQIVCQISSNSLLSPQNLLQVEVRKARQGALSNEGLIQFQFQAQITSVSPIRGSVGGGTVVTINGDGFVPSNTRIIVGSIDYTTSASINYTQIRFVTDIPPSSYFEQAIPIVILVGNQAAICTAGSCTFTWTRSNTPYVISVSPSSISSSQTLTLTGQNLTPSGSVSVSAVHVLIAGETCSVTAITNSTITCTSGALPVGNHSVAVVIDGIGNVISSPILTSNGAVSSISPTSGGTNGGILITINGNGFSRNSTNLQVTIGNSACTIVSSSTGQIQCQVPAQGSNTSPALVRVTCNGVSIPSTVTFTYNSASTPTVSSISPTSGVSGQTLTISGSNFVSGQTSVTIGGSTCSITSISSTSITCTVNSSPAGSQPVVVSVANIGDSNSNVQFQYSLQLNSVSPSAGSYGGGQLITLSGDGFNASNVAVTICSQPCQSISIVSNTQLTCITSSTTSSVNDQSCSLTISVGGLSQSTSYIYRASLTASVSSISPLRGGTGGGTLLTITGTNFPTNPSSVTVSIAGTACSVQSASSTTIVCRTGVYSQTTVQAPVIVSITGGGVAVGSVLFQYIDLWSSPWTWGGGPPPEEGTIVSIDSGKTVYFDTTTPILKALVIDNASLIFDDSQDVALNVEYILIVNGGRLQVGTESSPFQHRAVITMYGHLRSIELPIFGAKVLALRHGTVDLHGISYVRTWTRLGSTASAGTSQITLSHNVDWPVGSRIVVATTGDYLSQGETETRTITAVSSNGRVLTLDSPLTYTHLGVTQVVGSTSVEVRAEVGLLSHNIVYRGSIDSSWNRTFEPCEDGFNPGEFAVQTCFLGRYGQEMGSDQFGATIMASGSADNGNNIQSVILRISNIELFNVGQAFRLGRYPVHFHMNGNMSSSYIKSSSIHQSFNRAVNIHATHFLTVENNVVYNIMGGSLFLEDGVEVGNTIRGNLVVYVRSSSSLLNEDVTPAAIWVTNPNNIVEHNAVAGGTHFGYWYRLLRTPDGPSFAMYPNYCPYRQPFGRFFNNSVHSVGRFGVWIFPEYAPNVGGDCGTINPAQAIFDGLVAWKNNRGFEWVMSSSIQLRNSVVFDNHDTGIRCVTAINHQNANVASLRNTFYDVNTGSSVINSVVIGDSGVSGTPIVPDEGGLVVMWDRGLRVRNVSFFNFPSANTQAIFGPAIAGRCIFGCGGWLTQFSQLSFSNVLNRGRFRWVYDGYYHDVDGSLSGTANSIIAPPDGLSSGMTSCSVTANFINAITCPASMGSWIRLAFNKANLGTNGEQLNVYDSNNRYTAVLNLFKRLTHKQGYMMNLLARQSYLFQFQNANTTVNLTYTGTAYSLAPGDYLIIRHHVSYIPDRVYITSSTVLATMSNVPLTGSSNNGEWYYDNNTSIFSYIIKNPSTSSSTVDVPFKLDAFKCRYPNCEPPAQPGLELPATARPSTALYWSNDSHWYFAFEGSATPSHKPNNDTDVFIPRGIWMVIDHPLPRIRALRVEGVLEFEQGINNVLSADSIFINGGQFIAGWPTNPLTSNVDIVITGSSSTNVLLPNNAGSMGQRVIGVLGGFDLHGIPHNVTWTRLSVTAAAGQNTIVLSQPVDWNVGDEIVLTTTDTRIGHTERHTIASINIARTTLTLVNNLAYEHIVLNQIFPNGEVFHVAGAVGLLTRNIRVICRSQASELFGFRVLVTDYATDIWNQVTNETINTYYKGYARLSNAQFIGFGQFVDAPDEDKREGLHLYNLGDWNASRPTYVDSCSFDTGYFSAIGLWDTNGVPITNNIVYNTYESAIVVSARNNLIQRNLVTQIYWSGQAQPQFAEFNKNNDGAIMSLKATSVIMKDNLVAGVDRLAYRVQGNSCPGTTLPSDIFNDYDNNEAHSALAGFSIWPLDKGFDYDTQCILVKGFKTYKTYHYGLYINTARNIIVDSCVVADSNVGIYPFVLGPPASAHIAGGNTITIRNSLVIGSITPNDCSDVRDLTTVSSKFAITAIPGVVGAGRNGEPAGRAGISFPTFSLDNMIPRHPYTGIGAYPAIEGVMIVTNTTFAFFNDKCNRRDFAIHVSQSNDDGQHPVITDTIRLHNSSRSNVIFNGRPNLNVVNPSDCVDMDCDGLKKSLLTDRDGTLLGQLGSVFSEAEHNWGNQAHGVGDYRIPSPILSNRTGSFININITCPNRGIVRAPSCVYQPSWQMYYCPNNTQYRMLIIESMDSDTETRRLSPVAVISNGYLDLINGPQDHGWCNGYTCQKRLSNFMAIVLGQQHHDIYFTSTTPRHVRFRLLNADSSITLRLGLFYQSLAQVDVYVDQLYVPPTNKDPAFTQYLMLTDAPDNVTLTSPTGANYFDRNTQMANFLIRGGVVVDLKIADLLVLTFGMPAVTPSSFFTTNLLSNLAALLGVTPDKIRRVNIISASNDTRIRRQASNGITYLRVELRENPPSNLSNPDPAIQQATLNLTAVVINGINCGELALRFQTSSATGGNSPVSYTIQEPGNLTNTTLSIIDHIVLVRPPSGCRAQSPCDVQPLVVAYDRNRNVINQLGPADQPWQLEGIIVGSAGAYVINGIANYTNGQSQYTGFGVSEVGSYIFVFRFITPFGVSVSFVLNINITTTSSSTSVTTPILDAVQVNQVPVVSINEAFNITVSIVDKISQAPIDNITWNGLTWTAAVFLFRLPQYNANGSLITNSSSTVIIDTTNNLITGTNLAINDTGMYIIQMNLVSSNNQYNINFTSNTILVKKPTTVLVSDSGFPTSYISFSGNYNDLKARKMIESKLASIYNYLLTINFPLASTLTISRVDNLIIVSFVVSAESSSSLAAGVTRMTSTDVNVISDLRVESVVVEGTTQTSPSTQSSSSSNNNGVIIGTTVGIGGGLLSIGVAVLIYNIIKAKAAKASVQALKTPDVEQAQNGNPNPQSSNNSNNQSQSAQQSNPSGKGSPVKPGGQPNNSNPQPTLTKVEVI